MSSTVEAPQGFSVLLVLLFSSPLEGFKQIQSQGVIQAMHLPLLMESYAGVMATQKAQALWHPELKKTWSAVAGNCVTSICLSSKGKVAVSTKGSVLLFDPPPSFTLKKEIQAGSCITAPSFSSKGTDVVSGGSDGFLRWWQVDSGEEVCCTPFPQAEGSADLAVQEVACSKAGFVAATSGR
jgi:hypothetical protein